jgi:hypothetical protein
MIVLYMFQSLQFSFLRGGGGAEVQEVDRMQENNANIQAK